MATVRTVLTLAAVVVSAIGFAACRGGDGEATPTPPAPTATPSVSPSPATPQPTETPSSEEEVEIAYRRYWEVYAVALFELDGSALDQVMTGPRLARAYEEIERLRSEGRAVQSVVVLDPVVVSVDEREARVIDEYENGSYLIDAVTKIAIAGTGSPVSIREAFTLVEVDGSWKVFDSARQARPD